MSIGRHLLALLSMIVGVFTLAAAGASPAAAFDLFEQPKYASIVVDANTGEVLYGLHADQRRFPASITKVMTLYLTFEALATGRLRWRTACRSRPTPRRRLPPSWACRWATA